MKVRNFVKIISTVLLVAGCGNDLQFDPKSKSLPSTTGGGGGKFGDDPVDSEGFLNETFNAPVSAINAVDILFITDDSGSMQEDQANLAERFPNFIAELDGIDWRIAITTTDASSSGLNGSLSPLYDHRHRETGSFVLSPGPNAQTYFENTIQRRETGDGNERGVMVAGRAIQKNNDPDFVGFFRPQAALAVVILTDEDENSNQNGRNPNNPFDPNLDRWSIEDEPDELINTLNNVLPGKSFSFNAITVLPGDKQCFKQQGTGTYGHVYVEIADKTGGIKGSICDSNLTATVSSIGKNIRQQLASIQLKEIPEVGTVEVKLIPHDPTVSWTVTGDKLHFNKPLAAGTKIKVRYKKVK
ncbi:MAG: hypothetical protein SGI74_13845 [Oligoflexia bacterium]|nr:hypothetical protein [Oligoflexia bacterium]